MSALSNSIPTISTAGVAMKALGGALKKVKKRKRPKWRASELDAASKRKRFKEQKSFKNRKEVKYGTPGSSRPDLYKKGHSVEVKNYKIDTPEGKSRLVNNVTEQYKQRLTDLPKGTKQTVIIDTRGQKLTAQDISKINNKLKSNTNNGLNVLFMQ